MKNTVTHKTIKIKKVLKFPLEKVYFAFANFKARSQWSVPKGDGIKYLKNDFSVGGQDIFRCGTPGKLEFKGVVDYQDIEKNKRIIYTETVFHLKKKLAVTLFTTEFHKVKDGTQIDLIAQISSLDGVDMSKGYKQGWHSVIKNLAEYLSR